MIISGFGADADIVGWRIRVRWDVTLQGSETLADVPPVTVRRKTRDFEFPAPPAAGPDPFLLYDSSAFPPAPAADVMVTDLPGWETSDGGMRTVVSAISVAKPSGGAFVETMRYTTTTTLNLGGRPTAQHVDVLDTGDLLGGLAANTTYYYQLFSPTLAPGTDPRPYRATATATAGYALGRTLYEALPEIYRRHDVTARPLTPGSDTVPEAAVGSGQLRRFMDVFGAPLGLMRGSAEGLRGLRDITSTDYRNLPELASWIGWDLSVDAPIPIQRHEIRYAAALYRITGTIPGCMIWVKRLTGWDSRVKEFYPNVFFSNDVGTPSIPGDPGSRTVDTSDAALLANIGTPDDNLDYTYDTGTTDLDWYAFNVVGLFVTPPPDEPDADIAFKRDKLTRNLTLFMPVNIRGVVIVRAPAIVESPDAEQFDYRAFVTETERDATS